MNSSADCATHSSGGRLSQSLYCSFISNTHDLGESPVWDKNKDRVLWVDILAGEIHHYYPKSGRHGIYSTGQKTEAIALRKSGGLIAALENGFYEIDIDNRLQNLISNPEKHLPDNRFNDGKCDPTGIFWAGTMSMTDRPGAGKLYVLEKDLSVTVKLENVSCSNGLAWSPDQKIFYYIDTLTQNVVAYDFDDHRFRRYVMDRNLEWLEGSPVQPVYRKRISEVKLPAAQITSCTFGGKDLTDLYVTSARTGLASGQIKEQPYAGSLFMIKDTHCRGLETFEFTG
jgi:sugar lactone lactonase YvrE